MLFFFGRLHKVKPVTCNDKGPLARYRLSYRFHVNLKASLKLHSESCDLYFIIAA